MNLSSIPIPTPAHNPRLYLEECAVLRRVSVQTVRRWVEAGLPAQRHGRITVLMSDLMSWPGENKSSLSIPTTPDAEVADA
jgi:hypothetical protein